MEKKYEPSRGELKEAEEVISLEAQHQRSMVFTQLYIYNDKSIYKFIKSKIESCLCHFNQKNTFLCWTRFMHSLVMPLCDAPRFSL